MRQKAKIVARLGRRGPTSTRRRCDSNAFEMEWPPRSGKRQEFPEVDRAEWFDPQAAREKLIPAQAVFVDRLLERLEEATAWHARLAASPSSSRGRNGYAGSGS